MYRRIVLLLRRAGAGRPSVRPRTRCRDDPLWRQSTRHGILRRLELRHYQGIRHRFACCDDERPLYYEDIVPMQVLTKHATDYIQMQEQSIRSTSATRRASAMVHGQDVCQAHRMPHLEACTKCRPLAESSVPLSITPRSELHYGASLLL